MSAIRMSYVFLNPPSGPGPALEIRGNDGEGTHLWDFAIIERDISDVPGDVWVELRITDEMFAAFTDAPELFTALAEFTKGNQVGLHPADFPSVTVADVRAVLDGIGILDLSDGGPT